MVAVDPPVMTLAGLLRQLRIKADLSQEDLAAAAGVGVRTVSDLERGVALTARKDTARLLADALNLIGTERASFEAVARGRAVPGISPALGDGAGGVAAATRALPRDIGSFTGREPELRQLVGVTAGSPHPGVVSIHAIGGMAGIGKTTLAVHAAHQLAPRFPDGQIFLPLHGHTPGQRPVDPADALASLLLTAGVPAAQIPPGLEARTALWRDRLAGKQLLLLLDDAADSEQVRPLLPGSAGSLVLVTSRRHLTALEDARAVSLDMLPADEAAQLLIRLAARPDLERDDAVVAEITRLCGYLPLAIGMLGRQLHHHPAWTATGLAVELAAARDRLELMRAENLSVAAAFDLSYQDLPRGSRRLFRRLGLHPGADIDAYAAAALGGTDLVVARRHLETLYDHYLIAEPARGRYRFHDLIREHARTLAALDEISEQEAATNRLLDYYLHAAAIAETRVARQPRPMPDAAVLSSLPKAVPDLADSARALAWSRAERASLFACLDYVTRSGQHARVLAMTAGMAALLREDGPRTEAVARHSIAIEAAQRLGDRLGEARAHNDLGDVWLLTGENPVEAEKAHQRALELYSAAGDQLGQANALHNLGLAHYLASDYSRASLDIEEALAIYRGLGVRLGEANALYELGAIRRVTDHHLDASRAVEEALAIYRELGDRLGESWALIDLGMARGVMDDYLGAARAFEQALDICLDVGDRRGEAYVLSYLADTWQSTGDYPAAARALERALGISLDLGDRRAEFNALFFVGTLRKQTGDYPGAALALEQALGISKDLGDRRGEAITLAYLGAVRRLTGDYPGAALALEQALGVFLDLGDRGAQAEALNEIGTLHRVCGDLDRAQASHDQALALIRDTGGSPWAEAEALAGLARSAQAAGRTAEARTGLQQAREIFQRIGATEAADVAAELDALTETEPSQKGKPPPSA